MEDLVDLFLHATRHWYDDPENQLYDKREEVGIILLSYLGTRKDPTSELKDIGLIYALDKFQKEWLEEGGMFEEVNRQFRKFGSQ